MISPTISMKEREYEGKKSLVLSKGFNVRMIALFIIEILEVTISLFGWFFVADFLKL